MLFVMQFPNAGLKHDFDMQAEMNRLLDAEPSESVFSPRLIVVTERLSLLLIVKLLIIVTDEVDVCSFPPSLLTSAPKTSSVLFM